MSVSNEDREAALEKLQPHSIDVARGMQGDNTLCVCGEALDVTGGGFRQHTVEVLIAHGWGPRPTVSRARIDEYLNTADLGQGVSSAAAVRELMRELGIEVTDG